jgi:ectoine hydroxylase-related dioxygenase (phytanoyl-CoA dioxygenase family)
MTAVQSGVRLADLSLSGQRAVYEQQGYAVYPDMLSVDEVEGLREALDEVLAEARDLQVSNEKFAVTQGRDGRAHVRRIFDPVAQHEAFMKAAFNLRILDAVENLIGPNIQLHHSKLNLKPPSSPDARFEWHQDFPFFPHTNYDLIAVLIHIDEATEENGALRVIPGSHKVGPLRHQFAADGAFSSKLADQSVVTDESRWLALPCPAGGVEMHHCNMLHSSAANLGSRPRSALILQYRAADCVALGGRMSGPGFGMTVRGEGLHRARLFDGTVVDLPGHIADPLQRDG